MFILALALIMIMEPIKANEKYYCLPNECYARRVNGLTPGWKVEYYKVLKETGYHGFDYTMQEPDQTSNVQKIQFDVQNHPFSEKYYANFSSIIYIPQTGTYNFENRYYQWFQLDQKRYTSQWNNIDLEAGYHSIIVNLKKTESPTSLKYKRSSGNDEYEELDAYQQTDLQSITNVCTSTCSEISSNANLIGCSKLGGCLDPTSTQETNFCLRTNECYQYDSSLLKWNLLSSSCQNQCGVEIDSKEPLKYKCSQACFNYDCQTQQTTVKSDHTFRFQAGIGFQEVDLSSVIQTQDNCEIKQCYAKYYYNQQLKGVSKILVNTDESKEYGWETDVLPYICFLINNPNPIRAEAKYQVSTCTKEEIMSDKYDVFYPEESVFRRNHCFPASIQSWNPSNFDSIPIGYIKQDDGTMKKCTVFKPGYFLSKSKTSLVSFSDAEYIDDKYADEWNGKYSISINEYKLDDNQQYTFYLIPYHKFDSEEPFLPGSDPKPFTVRKHVNYQQSFYDAVRNTKYLSAGIIPTQDATLVEFKNSDVTGNCGQVIKYKIGSPSHEDIVFSTTGTNTCEIKQADDCQKIIRRDTSQIESMYFYLMIFTNDNLDPSIEKSSHLGQSKIYMQCKEEKVEVLKAHYQLPVMSPIPDAMGTVDFKTLFGTNYHYCITKFQVYKDPQMTQLIDAGDGIWQFGEQDIRTRQIKFWRKTMNRSFYVKVWGSKSGPGYEGVSQVDIRVCGYETIAIDPKIATFQTDTWDKEFELNAAFIQQFATTSQPECYVDKIALRQKSDPSKNLDANTGSDIVILQTADFQNAKIKIDPTKSKTSKLEFNIAYTTVGGAEGFKLVTVDIVQIQDNCMGGLISQTLNPEPLNHLFKIKDKTNNLNSQLQERGLRVLGDQIEFIFEEFFLQNLTAGTDRFNTGCNQVEYKVKLQYYRGQAYDGSNLDKIEPVLADYQFAEILQKAVKPGDLANSKILRGEGPSAYMKKWVETLDTSKNYNMLVFDLNDKDIKNMTYLLTIEASIPYSGELPTRLKEFVNKATFNFQIDVGLCMPTRFIDTSDEQVAFGNSSLLLYWMNNGTSIFKSPFDKIIQFEPYCGKDYVLNQTIDYSYVHNKSETMVDSLQLQQFVKYVYKPSGGSFFRVQTNNHNLIKLNHFQMKVTVKNTKSPDVKMAQTAFRFMIDTRIELFEQNYAPYFENEPQKVIQASNVSLILPIELPRIIDPNGDEYQVTIQQEEAKNYVSYNFRKNMLEFTSKTLDLSTNIKFTLVIKDQNSRNKLSSEYDFQINCTYCQSSFNFFENVLKNPNNDTIEQNTKLESKTKISATKKEDEEPPTLNIRPITNDGLVIIQFSKTMIFPSNWKPQKRLLEDNNTMKDYIKISIEPQDPSQKEKLKFDYYLSDLTKRELQIQMVFENPVQVSMSSQSNPDNLKIDFTSIFKQSITGQNSRRPVDFSKFGGSSEISKRLPAQMEASERNKAIIQSMNNAQDSLNSAVSINFILSFTFSFSMNFLWGLINSLQMIVYMPLLNLIFPAHVNALLAILVSVATFDVVPKIDDINEIVFNFNATTEKLKMNSQGYEQLGFETRNFTMNTGSLFIVIIVFMLNMLCLNILKCIRRRTDNVWLTRFQRKIEFDQELSQIILRFLLEGQVELLLSAIISFELFNKVSQIFESFSDLLSFSIGLLFLIMIIILPLVIAAVTHKMIYTIQTINQLPLDADKNLIAKHKKNRYFIRRYFGVLFDGINQREGDPWPMQYYLIYVVRRMIFVSIAYFFDSLVQFQVMLLTFMSLFLLMYLCNKQPFESKLQNRIEIFNEMTIMMVTYHLYYFTDWIPFPEMKNRVGLSFIGFTCLNILTNLSIMVYTIFKAIMKERRKKKYHKALKETNAQINQRLNRPYQKRYVMQAIRTNKTVEEVMKEAKEKRRLFFIEYVPGYLKRVDKKQEIIEEQKKQDEQFQRHIERTRRFEERMRQKEQEAKRAEYEETILNIKRKYIEFAWKDYQMKYMKK